MQKDFDTWNKEKKHVNEEDPRLYTVREVWWCSVGVNIGSEQDGSGRKFLRPVIILGSCGPGTCLVVPLTTSLKRHKLRFPVGMVQGKKASALLSQIRVIDTRRLMEKVGFLPKNIFMDLRKAVKDML